MTRAHASWTVALALASSLVFGACAHAAGGGGPQAGLTCAVPVEAPTPHDDSLAAACRAAFEPLARDDTEAWLAVMAPHVAVTRTLAALGPADAPGRLERLRQAIEGAGGPLAFLGLDRSAPVVVRVERDCRRCRRFFIAFRVAAKPEVSVMVEGARITQLRLEDPGH